MRFHSDGKLGCDAANTGLSSETTCVEEPKAAVGGLQALNQFPLDASICISL